ncbi:uncharacterized protein MONOS_38 [Monocercomonoides exilis]|uniref:uncharacterized protein n=1 Tax=Monocercomonoides exilis TaxID=2049356 RepID=UPI00355A7972|nr:hypothetical protein MONOS_38 [Monocercomonoides exilis]|eukprot:MONOS_38.1-p1 / transcript=MONOS_38.1 / gene=MONOS_38 / organism=Monocercomonoides_exilis_PA203 / gene_product=unspecified product / transcript_product=unspecified product / location=Mono_scaffold00001:152764-153830(+) / protein_length=324 / sequence_SO=supercontig / SO=protein_coding / is_pseudo=false
MESEVEALTVCSEQQKFDALKCPEIKIPYLPYSYKETEVSASQTVQSEINPLLKSYVAFDPIFHDLPCNPRLLPVMAAYISASMIQYIGHAKYQAVADIHLTCEINRALYLPFLGRPQSDMALPNQCYPSETPALCVNRPFFHSLRSVIEIILETANKAIKLSETDLVMILCLLDKLMVQVQKRRFSFTLDNATMIVVVAIILNNKFGSDRFHRNSTWSKMFNIPLRYLNQSELVFLQAIDYKVDITWTAKHLFKVAAQTQSYAVASDPDEESMSSFSIEKSTSPSMEYQSCIPYFVNDEQDEKEDRFDLFLTFFANYSAELGL